VSPWSQWTGDGSSGWSSTAASMMWLEVADVGVLAGAFADLEDQGAFLAGAGVDDALGELHVVDVKGADREPAIVGEVEHRLVVISGIRCRLSGLRLVDYSLCKRQASSVGEGPGDFQ